ncbi:peroxiredoxin family protein [Flavobacterium sp. CBA20B-1]|uniref:peroxiredoxin family protein n=1 Tax=unclassified Flavobacterium TaxID=196869 RepID=UPI002224AACB|nr:MULTISPECIES: peroxiredoxin family protein [unclassified Flavobacterium]WCM43249.1 peroxiredoxin family protein [Flavobacterium sp. CBA20B-1]
MKKLSLLLFIISSVLISCKKKWQDVKQAEVAVNLENYVDFSKGETPDFFTAKTISGKQINSKDYLGKNLVLLVAKADFEGKMSEGFNELFDKYKNNENVAFLTIIDGDNNDSLQTFLSEYNAEADFIDNTRTSGKKQINHSFHCWPATVLIDRNGKVIYATCGGYGFADEYKKILDSLSIVKK